MGQDDLGALSYFKAMAIKCETYARGGSETVSITGPMDEVLSPRKRGDGETYVPSSQTLLEIWRGFRSAVDGATAVLGVVEIAMIRGNRMGMERIGEESVFYYDTVRDTGGGVDVTVVRN